MIVLSLSLLGLQVDHFLWRELCLLSYDIFVAEELGDMLLGVGGILVPRRKKGPCCDTCWGTFCGI